MANAAQGSIAGLRTVSSRYEVSSAGEAPRRRLHSWAPTFAGGTGSSAVNAEMVSMYLHISLAPSWIHRLLLAPVHTHGNHMLTTHGLPGADCAICQKFSPDLMAAWSRSRARVIEPASMEIRA